MENIDEFIDAYKKSLDNLFEYEYKNNAIPNFEFVCMFKDICLKNYHYKSYYSSENSNQIVHEWVYNTNTSLILNINDIRTYLRKDIFERHIELSNHYTEVIQQFWLSPGDKQYILTDCKIKYIQQKQHSIKNGEVYKEFLDCYKNGYFN